MKMNRSNFGELLTPVHKKVFFNEYDELEKQYPKIATVYDMNKAEDTFPHMGALGMWDRNNEGNTINETEINQGFTATLEAERYDQGYEVTWELVRDDLYNVMKGLGNGGSAAGLAYGLQARVEKAVADVVNNGFTVAGYDGVPLFSDSHPLSDSVQLGDNLITGALDPTNLKAGMTRLRQQINPAGLKIMARAKELVVGPDLEFTAKEITQSTLQAFEESNTKNVIQGVTPVVMDYIEGNKWILRDPKFQNITLGWRDKPFFDSYQIPKTVDWFYFGYARFVAAHVHFLGLVASTGEEA
jgi:phage major head subunit gpT-like protein